MAEAPSSRVITMIDIGLSPHEIYVQFVPPATFGVIFDRVTKKVHLVRANGERSTLRRAADRIYTLRGFISLRRREGRSLDLGWEIEDEIIRHVLSGFASLENLSAAVQKNCTFSENARIIVDLWGPKVLAEVERACRENTAYNEEQCDTPVFTLPKAEGCPNAVFITVPAATASEAFAPCIYRDASQKGDLGWSQATISGGNCDIPYSTTSLQELEQFTIPAAFDSVLPFADPFMSPAFRPNPAVEVEEPSYQKVQLPYIEQSNFRPQLFSSQAQQTHQQCSNSMPLLSVSTDRFDSPAPPLEQIEHMSTNSKIATKPSSKPASRKRRRVLSEGKPKTKMPSNANANVDFAQRTDFYSELQSLVGLSVLKTRQLPVSKKLELARTLILKFGLPWNDKVLEHCLDAVNVTTETVVSRIRDYFLFEGARYWGSGTQQAFIRRFPSEILMPHDCDTCNFCISNFFSRIQLSSIVDVSKVLATPQFREAMVKFFRSAMQYHISNCFLTSQDWHQGGMG